MIKCRLKINNRFFMTESLNGKTDTIGNIYHIGGQGVLNRPGYCQRSLHYGEKKEPIPEGTNVTLDKFWFNFHGSYFKINYNGEVYDIDVRDVDIL